MDRRQALPRATAANAADFLQKVTAEMPWPIKAIQIDGGSEFMAEFETACQDSNIPLHVLPPRSPTLNGAVERCNGAWRYEFYATIDLPNQIDKIADHVDAFQHLYNHHRPHGALDGFTPSEYLKICRDRMTRRLIYLERGQQVAFNFNQCIFGRHAVKIVIIREPKVADAAEPTPA